MIGLYDIDFYHGNDLSLSLPFMKVYNYLVKQGRYPKVMKKNEPTSLYTQIFYFKENPRVKIPIKLKIDSDIGTFLGYGFCGNSGLKNPDVISTEPSFAPYDLNESFIRKKTLYKSIKSNSLVNWRDKDFSHSKGDKYFINDYEFMKEADWKDAFSYFNKTYEFMHPLTPELDDLEFLSKHTNYGSLTKVILPPTLNKDYLPILDYIKGGGYSDLTMDEHDTFLQYLFLKNMNVKVPFITINKHVNPTLVKWYNSDSRESFVDFCGVNWKSTDWLGFPYYKLLFQTPTTISHSELIEEIQYSKKQLEENFTF